MALLSTLKNLPLVLAGDSRADSPGHSAKYGTYSVLEMSCNKIIDFKLVQVRRMFYLYVHAMLLVLVFADRHTMEWSTSTYYTHVCYIIHCHSSTQY